ncbi:uncharacterized protein N7443_007146 [Penicillium atrosanguineum]|nr:uncharacterized protein N7443_007146 [Penicillium atrosanguineum]KAJ5118216.1 hypothetical protein N7526_009853 [Penicillium atrosanguineum]KAJ5296253.1 hypothetical protein N7443_007146 [Penicillium atrosanguineum]
MFNCNLAKMLSVISPLFLSTLVAGHGHVTNIVINGVSYNGWDIGVYPYEADPPTVVAWGTPNTGNGFISPDDYGNPNIICHENATNAKGYAAVTAGDKVNLQWTAWPDSHHGPVITYLANCGDSCETVDKTTLEFFKIDGVGLVSNSAVPGTWADDQLIVNNNSWLVEIPPTLAPGYYVLRHEIIALHSAESADGAQNYPQCFNLQVTGSGTASPAGVLGTKLYTEKEAGILVNIYTSLSTYVVPGPTLYSGAVSVTQSSSSVTATGTPTTGMDGTSASTESSAEASTLASVVSTSSSAAIAIQETTMATTVKVVSTTSTIAPTVNTASITSTPLVTTAVPSDSSAQSLYGQCGGINWTGTTACTTQATCSSVNPYYYQCVVTAV